jgi:hypothetical protein
MAKSPHVVNLSDLKLSTMIERTLWTYLRAKPEADYWDGEL